MVAEPDEAALSSKLKKAVWKYTDHHFKPIPINKGFIELFKTLAEILYNLCTS